MHFVDEIDFVTPFGRCVPNILAQLAALEAQRPLAPTTLAALLREGPGSRTTFLLAFAKLTDVEFEVVQKAVEVPDLDTLALLCRAAGFLRGVFVTLAVGLDKSGDGLSKAEEFGALYESVPVEAAQRALRFWKVQTTAEASTPN